MGNGTQLIVPKNHAIFRNFHFIFSNVDKNCFLHRTIIIDIGRQNIPKETKFHKKKCMAKFYDAVVLKFSRLFPQNLEGCLCLLSRF